MTKSKLDNKKEGFSVQNLVSVDKLASGLVSGVGSIAKLGMQGVKILGQKNYFAIKKGVIYQYEKATSREALDKIPI
jgi:hypothetical protein